MNKIIWNSAMPIVIACLLYCGCSNDPQVDSAKAPTTSPQASNEPTSSGLPTRSAWTPDSQLVLRHRFQDPATTFQFKHTSTYQTEIQMGNQPNPNINEIRFQMRYQFTGLPEADSIQLEIQSISTQSQGTQTYEFDSDSGTLQGLNEPIRGLFMEWTKRPIQLAGLNYGSEALDFSNWRERENRIQSSIAANHWQSFQGKFGEHFSERQLRWLTAPVISDVETLSVGDQWLYPYVIHYGKSPAGEIDREFRFEAWEDLGARKAAKITFGFSFDQEALGQSVLINNSSMLESIHQEGALWIDWETGHVLKHTEKETLQVKTLVSTMSSGKPDQKPAPPLEMIVLTVTSKQTELTE